MFGLGYKLKDYYALMHTKYLADAVFVHINKTGGSSIEKALQLPFQHRTARELHRALGDRRWKDRFSFAFVRNPWDKVASHYHFRVKTGQTGLSRDPVPFNDWVRLTYRERALPYYDQPKMFLPPYDWITDERGHVLVNYIGRFEHLENDFREVCTRLGRDVTLPHLKKSSREDYRRYFNDEAVEIVARWFERDIVMFGYRFE
jgi:chondroitin 4-sulfotransferase 11